MQFDFTVVPATFIARPNRFVVEARLGDGQLIRAHCADPGRLQELLLPGARLYVSPAKPSPRRRTTYDLRFVEHPATGVLVSLDTRVPNRLVGELLHARALEPFQNATSIRSEVSAPLGQGKIRSRFDFQVTDDRGIACWIEVKSVSLVEDGVALFPDAPTERGRRHLDELAEIVRTGQGRAAVVFIVQRDDAEMLKPHVQRDPAFAAALMRARATGVELYAYTCTLTVAEIVLKRQIPIVLCDLTH